MDLVQKARETKLAAQAVRPVSDEEIDLLIAFLDGQVTISQVEAALWDVKSSTGGKFRNWTLRAIKTAWLKGRIAPVRPKA